MKLTDTQLVVLSAALAREDGSLLPLPPKLKGGAVAKVCSALLGKGLVKEIPLSREEARTAPEKVFRDSDGAEPTTLRITPLALKELNAGSPEEPASAPVESPIQEPEATGASSKKASRRATKATRDAPQAAAPAVREEKTAGAEAGSSAEKQPRSGTKLDRLIEMLRAPEGASIKEVSEALDWMQHSVRGAVAGALKKKYGLTILTEKVEGRGTVYRIAA